MSTTIDESTAEMSTRSAGSGAAGGFAGRPNDVQLPRVLPPLHPAIGASSVSSATSHSARGNATRRVLAAGRVREAAPRSMRASTEPRGRAARSTVRRSLDMLPLVRDGFLLGWSVAWPPGPINAEMIRRALARGFWNAWMVGLGAVSGDFLWALAVGFGASRLATIPGVTIVLGSVSIVLLVALAVLFLRGALASWHARRGDAPTPAASLSDGARGGWLLGFTLALSSPWNLAFWFAVMGQQAASGVDPAQALVVACSVIAGALTWTVMLCGAVHFGARFATPAWNIATQAVTGVLMLFFAARTLVRLLGW
jgi:threonine/homoserine/homoserine lactone efflux protein